MLQSWYYFGYFLLSIPMTCIFFLCSHHLYFFLPMAAFMFFAIIDCSKIDQFEYVICKMVFYTRF
ncbi:hypothetical protein IC582_019490 [Cucumis melo]